MTSEIKRINEMLKLKYGTELDNQPRWRVVRAGEQTEKRITKFTDTGVELIIPEVRLVRKYQHIDPGVFVLERLTPVTGLTDLVAKMSYEPMWSFVDNKNNPLPVKYEACEFIVDAVYSQIDKANTHKKYKDPGDSREVREAKIKDMEDLLFGNETAVGDALAHGYGVAGFHQKVTNE